MTGLGEGDLRSRKAWERYQGSRGTSRWRGHVCKGSELGTKAQSSHPSSESSASPGPWAVASWPS